MAGARTACRLVSPPAAAFVRAAPALFALGCHLKGADSDACPVATADTAGRTACPDAWDTGIPSTDIAATSARSRLTENPTAYTRGDALGDGGTQLYVATHAVVERLTAPDWATPEPLWTSGDAGVLVPAVGDLTGDGLGDLVVGVPKADHGDGQVVILAGPVTGLVTWDDDPITVKGVDHPGFAGTMATGELTGDGTMDLLATAPPAGDGLVAWLFAGPIVGDTDASSASTSFANQHEGVSYGAEFAGALADLTGDGLADTMLTAPSGSILPALCSYDYRGLISIFAAPLPPAALWTGDADSLLTGARVGANFGYTVTPGDVDGDGYVDLLVATYDDTWHPSLDLLLGPFGPQPTPQATFSVSVSGITNALGDVDGDGHSDVLAIGGGSPIPWTDADPAGPSVQAWHGPFEGHYGLGEDGCTYTADAAWTDSTGLDFAASLGALDLDGDEQSELLVGSTDPVDASGVLDVWFGPSPVVD